MAVKILHSADWQIGKAFADIGDIDGDKAAELRSQRLRTVQRIAEEACKHEVDAVLVAGDVFETNTVSDESLRRTVNALSAFRGDWLLLPGNHDAALAESAWTRLERLRLPGNIKLLTRPKPVLIADHKLAILPAPLMRRHEAVDITETMDAMATPDEAVRVGVAHGSIKNRLPERSEALNEIAEDRADRARLDYLALGDWHGTLNIAPRTWYAGTPEPDRFKQNDPGNVLLVTIEGRGAVPHVEPVAVGHFRWHRITAAVHAAADLRALEVSFERLGQPYDRHLVHLELFGTVDLATREACDRLIADWRARFHVLRVFTEKLVAMPSDEDLDQIDTVGFIRTAVNRLREMTLSGSSEQHDAARLALQILYAEHMRAARR
jgi:DNA repair exonuclease SbcCD nuclease subunit